MGTPGPALKATGYQTSSDKSRQVATSPDELRPVGQDTLRGSRDLRDSLGGSWDLPEATSDHHNTFSEDPGTFRQGPGTLRALSEGPGTFRKQRRTIENDSKITEIMKMIENGFILLEMG